MSVGATATFGVDLGGTNLRVALVDPDGTIVEQRTVGAPDTLDGIVDRIAGAVRQFAPLRPDARALGVGAAGMVDRDGVIHYSPNVPAFLKAPVRARLEESVGMPTVVDNDANVAAVAELTHGAARGQTEVLLRHAGHRRRRRDRHRRTGAARRARLRGRDRPLPGGSRRPAVRVRRARALGGGRLGDRAGRAGRARAAAGGLAVGAGARRRRPGRRRGHPRGRRRGRGRRRTRWRWSPSTRRTSRSASSAW